MYTLAFSLGYVLFWGFVAAWYESDSPKTRDDVGIICLVTVLLCFFWPFAGLVCVAMKIRDVIFPVSERP